jgi:hypothetical protein
MLSIMRITIFDPVGIVQPVVAAFDEVGCVTRSVLGSNRGSGEVVDRDVAEFADEADVDAVEVAEVDEVVVLSSPNCIC